MGFPKDVKERAAVACNRSCCICHQFKGLKLEFHHIKQKADGGDDTFENCIPLCFDCHGDMGGVNPRHPKGNSYSENELRMHRDAWYGKCSNSADEPVCEDDRKLFEKIKRCFSGRVGETLYNEDLRWSHADGSFRELFELEYELLNPVNEFVNAKLEKLRGTLLDKIRTFTYVLSMNTFTPDSISSNRLVTHLWLYNHKYIPVIEVSEAERKELEATYKREAEEISNSASELWTCYLEFLRQGRIIINR